MKEKKVGRAMAMTRVIVVIGIAILMQPFRRVRVGAPLVFRGEPPPTEEKYESVDGEK